MTITKKHIIFIILALAIAGLIAVAGAFALRTFVKPSAQTITTNEPKPSPQNNLATEKEAIASITKAKEARDKGDFTTAITSYQQARTYYVANDNVEKTADIDIAISLLESEKQHALPPAKPVLAGEK